MAYEPPRERKGRRGSSNRRQSFGDSRKGRGRRSFGRDSGRDSRGPRRELKMTEVTCSKCGIKCEVPFKPTSTKPVYCRDCFDKQNDRGNNRGPSNNSSKELEMINEKLDKIMRSLSID